MPPKGRASACWAASTRMSCSMCGTLCKRESGVETMALARANKGRLVCCVPCVSLLYVCVLCLSCVSQKGEWSGNYGFSEGEQGPLGVSLVVCLVSLLSLCLLSCV